MYRNKFQNHLITLVWNERNVLIILAVLNAMFDEEFENQNQNAVLCTINGQTCFY